MSSRHIDFFAVLMITLVMFGLSKLSAIRVATPYIQLQNAIHVESCPVSGEILSRLAYILRP